jgi:hypothetical protein
MISAKGLQGCVLHARVDAGGNPRGIHGHPSQHPTSHHPKRCYREHRAVSENSVDHIQAHVAGYFQDAPIRIRLGQDCQLPSTTLRVQVRGYGFAADTGFFNFQPKVQFAMGSVGFSPIIRLRVSGGRGPDPSSRQR